VARNKIFTLTLFLCFKKLVAEVEEIWETRRKRSSAFDSRYQATASEDNALCVL
jgi:hypothetical protein